jgi:hypothetical protein
VNLDGNGKCSGRIGGGTGGDDLVDQTQTQYGGGDLIFHG